VVATGVGAIPDFVEDGVDGFLVPPRDAPALADRISRLLEDEPLREAIAAHVRARAPREFAIDVGCDRVAAVIRAELD
jgi:glycosyltransferase involved in cell wall biosynthesis